MKTALKSRQRGLSFFGLVIVAALIVFGFVIGAKVTPTFIEFQAVKRAIEKAKLGNTVPEVRVIYEKAQQIDNITSVGPGDLKVTKNGDKVVVSVAYNKEIELFAPVYLLIKYEAQTR